MSEINITIKGKLCSGRFEVNGNIVTVHSTFGNKSTQVGGLSVLKVAELLLGELVCESMD